MVLSSPGLLIPNIPVLMRLLMLVNSFFTVINVKLSKIHLLFQILKDEIWPNPLQFFMLPEVEESEEEEDGEEGDESNEDDEEVEGEDDEDGEDDD